MMRRVCALVSLLALSAGSATAAPPTKLRLCTGKIGNHYHGLGTRLAAQVAQTIAVEVVETKGSWDNLERIDTEPPRCDAILAQDDAWALYQFEKPKSALMMDRVAVAHPEYVHLLCNAQAGIAKAADLDPKRHTVLLDGVGSGTYITWALLSRLNPHYRAIPTVTATADEALAAVGANSAPQCMLMVIAPGGQTLTMADEKYGTVLSLIELDDAALQRRVGRDKRAVYTRSAIPAGTYKALAKDAVVTQRVDAVFFINPEWRARYPEAARALQTALAVAAKVGKE